MVSKEKKKEYNERYRSKLRNKEPVEKKPEKKTIEEKPPQEIEIKETKTETETETKTETETEDSEFLTISKQALLEYIERLRPKENPQPEPEPEEKKKVLPQEDSIVSKIQTSFINSTISTLSSMILPLSVLLISNYLPVSSKSLGAPQQPLQAQPETSTAPFQIPTGNLY